MSKIDVKKRKLLKIFGNRQFYHSIKESCTLARVGRSTFYRWLEDKEFKEKVEGIERKRDRDPLKAIKRGNVVASMKFLKSYWRGLGLRC